MQPIGLSLSRLSTKLGKLGCQFSELVKFPVDLPLFPPVLILPDSLSKITESIKKGLLTAPYQIGSALAQMVSRA